MSIDPGKRGLPAAGSQTIPTKDAIYTLTALGKDGSVSQPRRIAVHTHQPGEVVSAHGKLDSGIAKVLSFAALNGDQPISSAKIGDSIKLTAITSAAAESVKIEGHEATLTDLGDGTKQADATVTLDATHDGRFDCQAISAGEVAHSLQLHLEIHPAAEATTTQAPATTRAPSPTTQPPATTTEAPATPAPTTTKAPKTKMTGSTITVGGKHFVDWFNEDFRPKHPGNHPTLLLWKQPAPMFPTKLNKANFIKVFDKIDKLWAPELTVPEFLAFFGIFYNETGGTIQPAGEVGGAKYMFNATPGGKASYTTGGNRLAGNQLKAMGVISSAADIAAWNGTVYPDSASDAVKKAALQCDFYKYRGHGFIQTTFRPAYLSTVDPALKSSGYAKTCDQMTTEELENVIKTDPNVSLPMVRSFYKANCSKTMAAINNEPPNWYPIGRTVSGQKPYGDLFQWRCETIYAAMKKAGYTVQ